MIHKYLAAIGISLILSGCGSSTSSNGSANSLASNSAAPAQTLATSASSDVHWVIEDGDKGLDAYTFYSPSRGAFADDSEVFGKEDYWQLDFRCTVKHGIQLGAALRPAGDDPAAYLATHAFADFKKDEASRIMLPDGGESYLAPYNTQEDSQLWLNTSIDVQESNNSMVNVVLRSIVAGGLNFSGGGLDLQFRWSNYPELLDALASKGCDLHSMENTQ